MEMSTWVRTKNYQLEGKTKAKEKTDGMVEKGNFGTTLSQPLITIDYIYKFLHELIFQ